MWSNNSKRFDLISVSSRVEQYLTSASLNLDPSVIKILGSARSDRIKKDINNYQKNLQFFKKELNINVPNVDFDKLTIALYAPTHRDHINNNVSDSLYKMENYNPSLLNGFLKKNNIILLVREHSLFEKDNSFNADFNDSNILNFSSKLYPNIELYFSLIDIIITDYSGIYLDYLNSNKSIAFAHFDIEEYEDKRGLILPKDILFPGFSFKSQEDLIRYLEFRFEIDKTFIHKRNYLNSLLFETSPIGACKRTMLEIDKLII
tara:strand:- start:272 stop:1057 length:786 start_codon:yes stop_codon:yes gene_type:complete